MIEVDLKNKPAELLKLNPYGKVPVLVDGDAVIYESAIINEYLEEKFLQNPLMPKDLALRSRARIWIDFCNTRLQAAGSEVVHGPDPAKAREQLEKYLNVLDREMAGRDYLVGDYSLADITFIPFFVRQQRYGVSLNHLANVRSWMERCTNRPAVRSTL
ncbi:MAG: glutathione S-transferase family protein [Deltaproteobacteria bacterium]|nr:glutathione S-transferase family protein [Deltaproteobacteria bacterium]